MAKELLAIALLFAFPVIGISQVNGPEGLGIEEKLGEQVALDTVLKDESGREVTLRQLVDKPTILMFNYFRCPAICPVLISNMVEVVNQVRQQPGRDFRLIAVSFDPADTPQLARQKKANYLNQMRRQFSPDAWHFLTGSGENSRAVANSVGFKYRKEGDMYAHPGAVILLTPQGTISRYLYGTNFLSADVAMAIGEAAGGKVRPTVSKMLAFCYTYDPEGRRYVFSMTRVVGVATLVLVVAFAVFILRAKTKRLPPA